MGSVFSGKPSKEQRMEAQGGASKQGEDGQKVKITGGNTGSGRYDVAIGSDPLLGKEYVVNNDVISMNNGNERYDGTNIVKDITLSPALEVVIYWLTM
jgi:hypothetical protein